MWTVLFTALAIAAEPPMPVVAMGDGPVAGPPASAAPAVAGGWVPSLADCLEERGPGRFAVVDQTAAGETARSARRRAREVAGLGPGVVLVTLGAQELGDPDATPEALTGDLAEVVGVLHRKERPRVVLVGLVPPTLAQTDQNDPDRQRRADERTASWNQAVAAFAAEQEAVEHVDLWADWPRDAARAGLTQRGWSLSDQGHARVAAAVCDAVLASEVPAAAAMPADEAP